MKPPKRRSGNRGTTWLLLLAAVALLVIGAVATVVVVRRSAPLSTVHQIDTRLWFLQLKLRGEVPHVGWLEALRRVGPEWGRRNRFDLARIVTRGDAPCPVLWDTPLGRFWGTEQDGRELDLLTLEQAGGDIYEQRGVRVRDSDVVIDVGAHLGSFTRVALNRGARLVIAVEPDPVNTTCLARTFAGEIAAGRVRVVRAAAWHSPGSLTFEVGGSTQTGHVAETPTASAGPRRITVPAVTLDEVVDAAGVERVDFIKMDIEGAERHALAGARRLLAADKPRLAICIYHTPDDSEVIPRVILAANGSYETFTRGGFQAYFH